MKLVKLKADNGFTILELIISIAIIALLSVGVGVELVSYQRTVALEATSKDIVSELRLAQSKAISGEDGTNPPDGSGDAWGIRFSNRTPSTYAKFYGSAFNSLNVTATTTLPSSVAFTDPSANTDKNIIFTKITGTTTPSSIILQTQDGSRSQTIIIATSSIAVQ